MIELLLIASTWYITKVFYTKNIRINWPNLEDPNMVDARCFRCSRSQYIAKKNLRVPSYCISCK